VVSTDYRSLVYENQKEIASQMDISQDTYQAYSQGMQMVAHHNDFHLMGTAWTLFRYFPIKICAKTGTAQTGINNEDNHGAFVCYAPADNPEIAIAVYGEKAGSGSAMGSVAKGILRSYFDIGATGELDVYENTMS
jgi:penicillin-binding protein 2